MSSLTASLRRATRRAPVSGMQPVAGPATAPALTPPVDIAADDPLLAYFQQTQGAVAVDQLDLESPALATLRAAGMALIVPLISQGDLVGLLNLGPRLSERQYSRDDRKLLEDLAAHAAPAVRLAQLVRQQQVEARDRERLAQELRVAQLIQQQFLPKALPEPGGWHVAAHYQPAREVGGDFYDFLELPGGQIGVVVGDVTDKGVPAALVMATTHSILRSDAPRLVAPGQVLARVNELLVGEISPMMFVTCLYAVLDPATGALRYANAGHTVPYVRTRGGVVELRATGMPLGLMPGMAYEEQQAQLAVGDSVLLHSDGVAEAHAPAGQMFGFPRLAGIVGDGAGGQVLIDAVLSELGAFTGPEWEQEDDITLVTLERTAAPSRADGAPGGRWAQPALVSGGAW